MKTKRFDDLLKKLYTDKEILEINKSVEARLKIVPLEQKLFSAKNVQKTKFGKFIKKCREINKISLKDFSFKSGMTTYMIQQIENDLINLDLGTVLKIAKAFPYPEDTFIEIYFNNLLKKNKSNFIVNLKYKQY